MYNEQVATQPLQASFYSQVMMYFGLAILSSAFGTYIGFTYIAQMIFATPALMWVIIAAELALVLTSRWWSTKRPINYFLFALFTFITGITIVPLLANIIYSYGGPDLIIKALGATTLMFGGTAIFGWVTKMDLSGMRGFLTLALIGMIIVAIVGIFVPWGSTFEMLFAGFGIIVFSGYTMYDIQKLKTHPQDRPLDAALMLYLDIFNLFIYILRLLSASRR
ncbi:Bax inhibitor-1/YccA family protein [Candidatus Peregrinibacteria bacterium]|nr:Bax inhibitor-1/YccA family protein [Candidatus Peregrinibacteria bacterium]